MFTYVHTSRAQFYRNNKRERRRANVADIYEIRRDENNYISLLHLPLSSISRDRERLSND